MSNIEKKKRKRVYSAAEYKHFGVFDLTANLGTVSRPIFVVYMYIQILLNQNHA